MLFRHNVLDFFKSPLVRFTETCRGEQKLDNLQTTPLKKSKFHLQRNFVLKFFYLTNNLKYYISSKKIYIRKIANTHIFSYKCILSA